MREVNTALASFFLQKTVQWVESIRIPLVEAVKG